MYRKAGSGHRLKGEECNGGVFMKSAFRTIIHTLKVFLLFVSFTILFYIGMIWLNEEYEDYNRYDQPEGTSLKVSLEQQDGHGGWLERLKLFYWNGE